MKIKKTESDQKLHLRLIGRLDTTTSTALEEEINESLVDLKELELDFGELEYVSSAGLRVILLTQKKMNKQGNMVIANVNDSIMEVFEITGFVDILTIR